MRWYKTGDVQADVPIRRRGPYKPQAIRVDADAREAILLRGADPPSDKIGAKIPRRMASYTLANFRKFVKYLVLEDGPMAVHTFQAKMLREHFQGITETVVIIPKKNGKTTLMAALVLFRLWCQPDGKCFIAASSRDQATIAFDWAAKMVRDSQLEDVFKVQGGYRRMLVRGHDGFLRVVPSDPNTLDGIEPDLAIVDELHRHPNDGVYAVVANGLISGQMVTISTAGATMQSPLGKIRQRMHALPTFKRTGMYNHARDDDAGIVMHEWCLGEDDDPADMAKVAAANPAPWQTKTRLLRRYKAQQDTPWQFLRFACGVWTEGEEPWLKPEVWDGLPRTELIPDGATVSVGIRVGAGHLDAALVYVHDADGVYQTGYQLLDLADGGGLAKVEQAVRDLNERYDVRFNAYVSKTFDRSAQLLADEGMVLVSYPIGARTMDMAETLLKVIGDRRLAHEGPGPFRQSVLAGQVKTIEAGWKFVDKPGAGTPISALLALAAAVHVAETQQPVEPMFAWT